MSDTRSSATEVSTMTRDELRRHAIPLLGTHHDCGGSECLACACFSELQRRRSRPAPKRPSYPRPAVLAPSKKTQERSDRRAPAR